MPKYPEHARCPDCDQYADRRFISLPEGYDPRLTLFICSWCDCEFYVLLPQKEVTPARLIPLDNRISRGKALR